jgi:large subunit ribosomal protein L17
MRHANDHRKLGRSPSHRKALLKNLMNSLVLSERIETTVPKAKELRPLADKLITLGKRGTLHARRRAFSILSSKDSTDKLFDALSARFAARDGGYTRIVRIGFRPGDGAEMAIIEYLPAEEKKAGGKGKKKKAAPRKPAEKAAPKARRPAPPDKKGKASTGAGKGAKTARAPQKKQVPGGE